MRTEIIVVGAGHGGLVAAGKLAQRGLEVVIFEKSTREKLSWNWKDCFDLEVLEQIGLPKPKPSEYATPENFRFFSPNEKHFMSINIHPEKREKSMERRVLIEKLVDYAMEAGAEINFNQEVTGPVIERGRILGVKAGEENHYAEMIVDSAGINTPIRPNLPNAYKIPKELTIGEYFHTYRGYFNKKRDKSFWDIIIGYMNKPGIAWINSSEEMADILIGSIKPFSETEIEELLQDLRRKYPIIGDQLLRGGKIELIPIRRPLEKLVGNNYAVIGDAACMANPLNGAGIANTLFAGNILAETIINAHETSEEPYTTANLWPYQVEYNLERGSQQGNIEILKDFLITMDDFSNIDFLFKNEILSPRDIEASMLGENMELGFVETIKRALRGISKIGLLFELVNTLKTAKKVKEHYLNTPWSFNKDDFKEWREKLDKYFKPFYKKFQS
ncbi:MAG: FAD-dependent monooxygenase [Promethearchaeia archaeon]